jgi:hypothetical protein
MTIEYKIYQVVRGFTEIENIYQSANKRHAFIGGSYAAYMATPVNGHIVTPNDVDIFASSNRSFNNMCIDLLKQGFTHHTTNDVVNSFSRCGLDVQLIRPNPKWQDFPDDILNDFDLNVSRAILTSETEVYGDIEIGSETGRVLMITNPIKSMMRILKYHKRGIQFDEHEILKLFKVWMQLDETKRQEYIKRYERQIEIESTDYDYYDDDYFDGE